MGASFDQLVAKKCHLKKNEIFFQMTFLDISFTSTPTNRFAGI